MATKRLTIALTPAQMKALEALGKKYQLDMTNTVRVCIAKQCEAEGIKI